MALTYPFQGTLWFWEEANYSDGDTGAVAGPFRVSNIVTDARIDSGDMNLTLRGINDDNIIAFESTVSDPVFHVEYVLQDNDAATEVSLASYAITRSAVAATFGDLKSVCFELGVNTGRTAADSYYLLKGCKAKNCNVSASRGEPYTITIDFSVASIAVSGTKTGTDPGVISDDYGIFNMAGSITQTGGTQAFITDSIDFTVENNLTDYWDSDCSYKQAAIPGAVDITGSCDISLDDGGDTHWNDVVGRTDVTSIAVNTGLGGDNVNFTLNDVRFDNTSVDVNVSGEAMMTSQPFTAKSITLS